MLAHLRQSASSENWHRVEPTLHGACAEQPAFARKQVHPLALKSPRYGMVHAILRLLSVLSVLFVVRLPDNGVTAASIQVILGLLILVVGEV